MPIVPILIQNMPTIIAGITYLFKMRHPTATLPSDEQILHALQAALSGSHDVTPLLAIAAEQAPQIRDAIIKIHQAQLAPEEVAAGPSEAELRQAFEGSFREACRASLDRTDDMLAEIRGRKR